MTIQCLRCNDTFSLEVKAKRCRCGKLVGRFLPGKKFIKIPSTRADFCVGSNYTLKLIDFPGEDGVFNISGESFKTVG
jgi:hypothetical protein